MIEIDEKDFLKKFPSWNIVEIAENRIELQSQTLVNKGDTPAIVAYLYERVLAVRWTFNLESNKVIAERNKISKYNRMYTSGSFDIFHYGHLNILAKSKALCDYLIVGVSTDELILKEKGKMPVIPFEERIKLVEAIGLVDEVIVQKDKNKQRIVDMYNIDAISVGSDWKGRYPKVSCAMEYFEYTPNVSSTILKNSLKLT